MIRRWLAEPDLYDEPPAKLIDEWNLIQAAKWANLPPWELENNPWWLNRILSVMSVSDSIQRMTTRNSTHDHNGS